MTAPAMPLTTVISQASQRNKTYRVLKAQMGDGYMQTAADGINNIIDGWTIVYTNLTKTDRDTVQTFLDSVGQWIWFSATIPPDVTSKKWRVVGPIQEVTTGVAFTITFTIQQVFDQGT